MRANDLTGLLLLASVALIRMVGPRPPTRSRCHLAQSLTSPHRASRLSAGSWAPCVLKRPCSAPQLQLLHRVPGERPEMLRLDSRARPRLPRDSLDVEDLLRGILKHRESLARLVCGRGFEDKLRLCGCGHLSTLRLDRMIPPCHREVVQDSRVGQLGGIAQIQPAEREAPTRPDGLPLGRRGLGRGANCRAGSSGPATRAA